MTDSILFAAEAGPFVYLGVDADPARAVALLQPGCPYPMRLLTGWVISDDQRRTAAYLELKQSLAAHMTQTNWFWMDKHDMVTGMAAVAKQAKGRRWNVRTAERVCGDRAPPRNDRRIVTPDGIYSSAAEAGRMHGISRQGAWDRATRQVEGWNWEDRLSAAERKRYPVGAWSG